MDLEDSSLWLISENLYFWEGFFRNFLSTLYLINFVIWFFDVLRNKKSCWNSHGFCTLFSTIYMVEFVPALVKEFIHPFSCRRPAEVFFIGYRNKNSTNQIQTRSQAKMNIQFLIIFALLSEAFSRKSFLCQSLFSKSWVKHFELNDHLSSWLIHWGYM
jgi:hypothetical protein